MNFDEFLAESWKNHAEHSDQTAAHLPEGLALIERVEHIPQMAQLVAHVFGEHLGRWSDGIEMLRQIKQISFVSPSSEADHAVTRAILSLELASGHRTLIDELSLSNQIRVLSSAAAALSGQGDIDKARGFFERALAATSAELPKEDPAHRALAVTANNLASALEEQPVLSPAQIDLMITAARTARQFWAIAGGWLQIERAEYRLSRTFCKAGDAARAVEHARLCLEIIFANQGPALEFFFAYEALALAEKASGSPFAESAERAQRRFDELSAEDKTWCADALHKIRAT